MPPILALSISLIFIFVIYYYEFKRNLSISKALWVPLLWYAVASTRPLSVWLYIFGFSLPEFQPVDPTEGSPIDRLFFSILIVIGFVILQRRRLNWYELIRGNLSLFLLFSFMTLSILWSDYPIVSLKRLIKVVGSLVMVLVVLTEEDPLESIAAVIRRCAYFHIPLSIVTIKYFRDIGINWDWSGEAISWIGLATSKNTLGQIAATSALLFIFKRFLYKTDQEGKIFDYVYIAMSLYLLKGSDDSISMTSLSIFLFCIFVFSGLNFFKNRFHRLRNFFLLCFFSIFFLLLTIILHSIYGFSQTSILGRIITFLGRDITLTGRTEIWNDVFTVASQNPMIGVGFGAFWIGSIVNIPWSDKMTWTIGQAHNGFVDTYLQIGWIGVFLLAILIFSQIPKILKMFKTNFEYACLQATLFLFALFVNITESALLRGDHNMWFIFLLSVIALHHHSSAAEEHSQDSLNSAP